ncbi:hypothetical protein BSL82_11950 [Tardibacter chloracetimidivorans]|uniref:Short-chain dehydrogenase n=1 Tax=Tardibacter chloracetimidivorans TaxID=1921510 RepID=A0A1L3ZZQ5_9SPHN|nr:hypothetical protein BSL82_11950 [Tardibacter chloracetimidivorans]
MPLAVVVGAGGIGRVVARRLGQQYRLLLADRDQAHLDRVAEALRADGYDLTTVRCDVTVPEDTIALADAVARNGPMRALAHVVGLSPSMGSFADIMRVDLVGAALVERALLPLVTEGTAAVFVSSIAAHQRQFAADVVKLIDAPLHPDMIDNAAAALGEPATPVMAYMLSKYGLNRLCRARATEWGLRGARIVSLSPGLIASPMGAMEYQKNPIKWSILKATPLRREGTMHEVASALAFLLSDDASFINGTDILVDGGVTGAFAASEI